MIQSLRKLGLLTGAVLFCLALGSGNIFAQESVAQNDLLNATLWVSNSVEYQANTLAMFQLAKIRLDQALANKSVSAALEQTGNFKKLPPAIILDADETILDNGPYEAWLIKTGQDYSGKTWDAWTKAAVGRAIPGALEFLNYAHKKGVTIFYISNRTGDQEAATRDNFKNLGYPIDAKVDNFLFVKETGHDDWGSKKGVRRAFVAQHYRVLLLLGDNYGDFSDDYGGTEADRQASFKANIAHVGKDWLVIANPEYGSFESAPFKSNYGLSPDARRQMKIDALPVWDGAPK